MRDQIEIVETDEEAAKLGWTCLETVGCDEAWQLGAWVWCKAHKFVLLADDGNGYCHYTKELSKKEAFQLMDAFSVVKTGTSIKMTKQEYLSSQGHAKEIALEALRNCPEAKEMSDQDFAAFADIFK